MNCILCSGVVKQYAPTSYMGLPINYCKKCDLYATGNSKSEVNEKLFEYYKDLNEYYYKNPERANMQIEIIEEYGTDDESEYSMSDSENEYWSDE